MKNHLKLKLMPTALMLKDATGIPTEVQLLPFGELKHPDGDFKVTANSIQDVVSNFEAKENDVVIDYEHQSHKGVEAPAAGWIKQLLNKGNDGLWAVVEWTPRAVEYLKNREYRYMSPGILVSKTTKQPRILVSAALTNVPHIDGMEPVVNKSGDPPEEGKDGAMLKKLLAKLGMSDGTPEAEALEQIDVLVALKAKVAEVLGKKPEDLKPDEVGTELLALKDRFASTEVLQALELKADATLTDVQAKVVALKNPGSYVGREEFETLQLKLKEKEADDLVAIAMSEGKVAPAQEKWAREYALKDATGFAAFVAKATPVVPVHRIGKPPEDKGKVTLDDDTLIVAKQFGNTEEDLVKYGGVAAADES